MPSFGKYLLEREHLIAQDKEKTTIEQVEKGLESRKVAKPSSNISTISNMIGKALPRIGTYGDLNNKQQVVAVIDDVCTLIFYVFIQL